MAEPENLFPLPGDGAEQFVGRVREQPHALFHEVPGDRIERDSGFRERGEHLPCVIRTFLEAIAQLAVIAEGLKGRRRHGIDSVWTDQLLNVEDVTVVLVLGPGRSP